MPKPIDLSHRQWRVLAAKVKARAKANGEPCCIGGEPLDWDAKPNTPTYPTVEHLDPRSLGGPVLAPMHRLGVACLHHNSSRGDGTKPMKAKPRKPMRHSEAW